MSVGRFKSAFINASSATRSQIIWQVSQANADNPQIGNMLSNLDVNYKVMKDPKDEAIQRRRADNIYFVCQQLEAFPNFKYH